MLQSNKCRSHLSTCMSEGYRQGQDRAPQLLPVGLCLAATGPLQHHRYLAPTATPVMNNPAFPASMGPYFGDTISFLQLSDGVTLATVWYVWQARTCGSHLCKMRKLLHAEHCASSPASSLWYHCKLMRIFSTFCLSRDSDFLSSVTNSCTPESVPARS